MSTITKERAQQIFLGNGPEPTASEERELARIALASLEAEPAAWVNQRSLDVRDKITAFTCKESADIYGEKSAWSNIVPLYSARPAQVSVPDAATAIRACMEEFPDSVHDIVEECAAIAESVCRAAMLQGAESRPELTVWYGSMPESNGKANWTAILHRKGEGRCIDGFTIDRSEYPGRILYAADRVRYLIGEKSERPSILDYDADAHSGYVKPGNSPVIGEGRIDEAI